MKEGSRRFFGRLPIVFAVFLAISVLPAVARADLAVTAFKQAVAEAAARDQDIAAFYRTHNFQAVWTNDSAEAAERRSALVSALRTAPCFCFMASVALRRIAATT